MLGAESEHTRTGGVGAGTHEKGGEGGGGGGGGWGREWQEGVVVASMLRRINEVGGGFWGGCGGRWWGLGGGRRGKKTK